MAKATIFSHKNMTTPQPENTTYRILRLTTEGWTLADDQAVNLSKEQCDAILQNFVQMEGVKPSELRAIRET